MGDSSDEVDVKMQPLDQLALKQADIPDKASTGHWYTRYYDRHFRTRRRDGVKLLEIGVWEGASLSMWMSYFQAGRIVGADIDLSRCKVLEQPPRLRLWQCDQSNEDSLRNVARELGPFDIIIDDGSHYPPHQVLTFNTLWPYLRPGGLYCVEDLHVNYTVYKDARPSMVDFIGTVLQGDLHRRGKTTLASRGNNNPKEIEALQGRECEVGEIHLYPYLAIVEKI